MRKLALPIVLGAAIFAASTAHAQSFTYEMTWQPVESVGGFSSPDGPQYRGGVVEGRFTTTFADGTTDSGTVKCVGMDQPDGGVFAIHLTCSFTAENGAGTSVYGCNYQGAPGPGTALGCIGGIESTEGEDKGRRGGLTMDWYSAEKARGTGQWYGAGD